MTRVEFYHNDDADPYETIRLDGVPAFQIGSSITIQEIRFSITRVEYFIQNLYSSEAGKTSCVLMHVYLT